MSINHINHNETSAEIYMGQFMKFLVHIAYAQKPHLSALSDISSGAGGVNSYPSHYLHPYLVTESGESFVESAHFGSTLRLIPKPNAHSSLR